MEAISQRSVELSDMLEARERRVLIQQQMIEEEKQPLVCLTLNIPGPVKVLPHVPEAFEEGCRRIEAALAALGASPAFSNKRLICEFTGFEAFYSVGADALELKKALVPIEDQDRLGRLFDIDVIKTDKTKVSREDLGLPPRTCLLCESPAHVCSRSRTHSVAQLTAEITDILNREYPSPAHQLS